MRTHRLLAVLLVAGVLTPTTALGGYRPPRPAAGKWKISGGGGFTVGKSRKKISGLTMPGCGAGKISAIGKQKLALASRGGYSNWIIGKNTPKTSNGVTPITIKVHEADKVVTGSIYIVFAEAGVKRDNSGALDVEGCGFMTISASH